jgi:thymidine kinase
VLAYGLRTDFLTRGFPGSSRLLELAHELQELKTICRCGRKAVLNGRKLHGEFVREGSQVAIEDQAEIEYEALCAADYKKLVLDR